MTLTKTTTRAIAFSIALVAAGATVASAAVFQLPILGFGRAAAASATAAPARRPVALARKVRPKVIVKTRFVDDIVHRPAPAGANATRTWTSASAPSLAVPATSSAPSPKLVTASTVTPATSSAPSPKPAAAGGGYHEGGHDREHEAAPIASGHDGGHAEISTVDQ